jgi:hypothetical protein
MSHFLARLVERARGTASRIDPLIRSSFVPANEREAMSMLGSPNPSLEQTESAPQVSDVTHGKLHPDIPPQPLNPMDAREPRVQDGPLLLPTRSTRRPDPERFPIVTNAPSSETRADAERTMVAQNGHGKSPALARLIQRGTLDDRALSEPKHASREAPVVRVTIGRIDVRAAPAPSPSPRKSATSRETTLSLDAYLKSRKEGMR